LMGVSPASAMPSSTPRPHSVKLANCTGEQTGDTPAPTLLLPDATARVFWSRSVSHGCDSCPAVIYGSTLIDARAPTSCLQ
jgi:hypothetical protein